MDYTIPDWDKNNFKKISESQEDRYTLTRYELPDVVPVEGYNDPITVDYYKRRDGAPTLIVHPILGGEKSKIAITIAKYFTRKAKWNVVLIHRARVPMSYGTLEAIESGFFNTITNNLQVFEWLEFHNLINRAQTVCMGVSMGAITTAMLSGLLPVKGFICVMAGADIPDILSFSEEDGVVEWREPVLQQQGLTQKQLREKLKPIIKTDPLNLAPQADPKKVLLFIALFDKAVPTSNQRLLRKKFVRSPKTRWMPTGHKSILFVFPYILSKARRWAKKAIRD